MFRNILTNLKEPSTYAGIAGVLAGAGVFGLSPDQWSQVFGALASLAGVVAMLLREDGDKKK